MFLAAVALAVGAIPGWMPAAKNQAIKGLSNETTLSFCNDLILFCDVFRSASGATLHYSK
jgi:hypothetical protein